MARDDRTIAMFATEDGFLYVGKKPPPHPVKKPESLLHILHLRESVIGVPFIRLQPVFSGFWGSVLLDNPALSLSVNVSLTVQIQYSIGIVLPLIRWGRQLAVFAALFLNTVKVETLAVEMLASQSGHNIEEKC